MEQQHGSTRAPLAFLAAGALGESIIPAINKLQDVFSQVGGGCWRVPPPGLCVAFAAPQLILPHSTAV